MTYEKYGPPCLKVYSDMAPEYIAGTSHGNGRTESQVGGGGQPY